jgi:hypothetical protein
MHPCIHPGNDLVYVIEGEMPVTPDSLYGKLRIADWKNYDTRYFSFSLGESSPPSATYYTVDDKEIKDHYVKQYGEGWNRKCVCY